MSVVLLVAGTGLGFQCQVLDDTDPMDPEAELASIEVTPATLTFSSVGQIDTLTALGRDADGGVVTGWEPTWTSAEPAVASVSREGIVTAAGVGSSTITASADGVVSQPVEVTVASDPPPSSFRCTLVIGFSQTNGWYSAGFESVVEDAAWEELWQNGAAIDLWADPQFDGWSNEIVSPCTDGPNDPDRVLLTISADFQDDPDWWADHIRQTVANIRDRYGDVRQIMLQPVVGGPGHAVCSPDGVRASQNHPVIDEGIARVVEDDIIAGFSPEVRTCEDYVDFIGHLSGEASAAVAATLGAYYAAED